MDEATTQENDTLDSVIFRSLGIVTDELLEEAYTLNPDLADYGETLPAGVVVKLPPLSTVAVKPTIKLYD